MVNIMLQTGLFIMAMFVLGSCEMGSKNLNLYNQQLDPNKQVSEALHEAKLKNKLVLLQIGGNWCPDAQRLDSFYQNSPSTQEISDHYIHVRVHLDRENPDAKFFSQLPEFSWVPTLFILDFDGRIVLARDGRELENLGKYSSELINDFLQQPFNTQ